MTASEAARLILAANQHGDEIVSVLCLRNAQRVLFSSDGAQSGTLGSRELDDAAAEIARSAFSEKAPVLTDEFFAELHVPVEALLIFGAGHIAVPLAEIGVQLGFAVTVLDDRDEFATEARFPAEADVQLLDYTAPLQNVTIDRNTYIVLVTRAHQYDFDCLREVLILETQPRYIGMIGSRRRVRAAFTALLDGGIPRGKLQTVHAPVGIDIGAETPAEIAVSIAAELIRVRRGGSEETLSEHERVAERFFAEPLT